MNRVSKACVLGVATGIAGLVATCLPFGVSLEEDVGLDLLFGMRGPRAAPPEVVVVGIDRRSTDALQVPARPDRWPRTLHARLVETLSRAGAAVIAFDIFFEEPRTPAQDAEFAAAMKKARNVVLVESLRRQNFEVSVPRGMSPRSMAIEQLVSPTPVLATSAVALAPFPLPKVPVRLSQYWKFKAGSADMPTLPVVAYQIFALDVYDDFIRALARVKPDAAGKLPHDTSAVVDGARAAELVRSLRVLFTGDPALARRVIDEFAAFRGPPVAEGKRRKLTSLVRMYEGDETEFLNFYGPPRTIRTIPYHLLVRDTSDAALPDVRGKAVFVGSLDQKDGFYTVYTANGVDVSGVEVAATAFANLAEDFPVRPLGWEGYVAALLLWGIALGALCSAVSTAVSAVITAGAGGLYLLAAAYRFNSSGEWYPLALPLLVQVPAAFVGALLWKYLDTRAAFGIVVGPETAESLARDPGALLRPGETLHAICLMTDVKGSTKVAESMNSANFLEHMNAYFSAIEPTLKGINYSNRKGDSVFAVWIDSDHARLSRRHACLAALDLQVAVERFNEKLEDRHKLRTRIGLHCGEVQRGWMGGSRKRELAFAGAGVQTVAKIEQASKRLGTWFLASSDVLQGVGEVLTRELGRFLLEQMSSPLVIHEVLCRLEAASADQLALCEKFQQGLAAYRTRRWREARTAFGSLACSTDRLAGFYLARCNEYEKSPPGEDWSDVISIREIGESDEAAGGGTVAAERRSTAAQQGVTVPETVVPVYEALPGAVWLP